MSAALSDAAAAARPPETVRARALLTPTAAGAALKATHLALGLAGAVLLARLLGPAGYGVYGLALAWVTVLTIPGQMGLPTLLTREAARYRARGQWGELRALMRWANWLVLGVSPLLIALLAGAWAAQLRISHPPLAAVLAWGALLIPLGALSAVRAGLLRGLHRVVAGQVPELLLRPLALVVIAGALYLLHGRLTPAGAMAAQAGAAALAFVAGVLILWRVRPPELRGARPVYAARAWWASLIPLSVLGGMQVLSSQVDVLLIGTLGTPAEVGLYRVAAQGAMLVTFGLIAVNMVVAPEIARLHAAGAREALARVLTVAARIATAAAVPVTLVLWWQGDVLLRAVFGEPFAQAWAALAVLCAGELVNALVGPVGVLLNMTGHERDTVKGVAVATAVGAGVSALLIPRWGALGAACGHTTALVLWNVLLAVLAWRRTGQHCLVWTPQRRRVA